MELCRRYESINLRFGYFDFGINCYIEVDMPLKRNQAAKITVIPKQKSCNTIWKEKKDIGYAKYFMSHSNIPLDALAWDNAS